MADAIRVSGPVSGTDKTLSFETGKLATQSMGAVVATIGGTTVFATANAARTVRDGIDFFPLTVDVEERAYAAGKIPGAFFRREGRPTERETLVSRLIDRPIRPLFVEGYRNETQVIATVLSHDMESDPDIVAMVAASAALTLSGIPFMGPIGAARVGYIDGEYRLNTPIDEMPNSALDLVVAGTTDAIAAPSRTCKCQSSGRVRTKVWGEVLMGGFLSERGRRGSRRAARS